MFKRVQTSELNENDFEFLSGLDRRCYSRDSGIIRHGLVKRAYTLPTVTHYVDHNFSEDAEISDGEILRVLDISRAQGGIVAVRRKLGDVFTFNLYMLNVIKENIPPTDPKKIKELKSKGLTNVLRPFRIVSGRRFLTFAESQVSHKSHGIFLDYLVSPTNLDRLKINPSKKWWN